MVDFVPCCNITGEQTDGIRHPCPGSNQGARTRRPAHDIRDVDDISGSKARTLATAILAEIRQYSPVPAPTEDTILEAFAEMVFRRHE